MIIAEIVSVDLVATDNEINGFTKVGRLHKKHY